MKCLAMYYFISIPIRISFRPWSSMIDPEVLGWDVTADGICFLNLFVRLNTAYMNSRATWITARSKTVLKIHFGFFIAAFPFDWYWPHLLPKIFDFRVIYLPMQANIFCWCNEWSKNFVSFCILIPANTNLNSSVVGLGSQNWFFFIAQI